MRPGLTQAAIKFIFSKSDCISFIVAVSLFSQFLSKNRISFILSGVTASVIFSVLSNTPIITIVVEGKMPFFASLMPHFSRIDCKDLNQNVHSVMFLLKLTHLNNLECRFQF